VHLVLDNYGTAQGRQGPGVLAQRPRHYVHLTQTSGSWLNLAERLFEVTERCA
jgi:hypothetical protein